MDAGSSLSLSAIVRLIVRVHRCTDKCALNGKPITKDKAIRIINRPDLQACAPIIGR